MICTLVRTIVDDQHIFLLQFRAWPLHPLILIPPLPLLLLQSQLQTSTPLRLSRPHPRQILQTTPPVHPPLRLLRRNGENRRAHGTHPTTLTRREREYTKERGEAQREGGQEVWEAGADGEVEGEGEGEEGDGGEVEGVEEE